MSISLQNPLFYCRNIPLFINTKDSIMSVTFSSTIKRVASAIPQSTRKKLETHAWCIFTDDEMTQNSVMEYLATIPKADNPRTRIMYNGKERPVISLPFDAVMFLKNNKARSNYKYTPYHRETNKVPWSIWMEGSKTPPQSLRNNNYLFGRISKNPPTR